MEDIIISLEPAFHRVERFLLWHNRYASFIAFAIGHCLFYGIARAGLRPFCAITLVLFIFHLLDCLKKKRLLTEESNLSELTQLVLCSYRQISRTHNTFNTIKTENRVKYSLILLLLCLLFAYIGMKINGFYFSYITMLIVFTLPAIVYHKLMHKLLKRLAPILEQLDQSMEYKRRTLIDRKDLLVKMQTPGLNQVEDDEDVLKLEQIIPDDHEEDNSMTTTDQSESLINSLRRQSNTTDSSSFNLDDETARISELYGNIGDRIDGKHRIKIKGDEIKIKGYSNRPRPKVMDTNFFPSQDQNSTASSVLSNSPNESDLTSFDFLNDYDDKS